MNSQDKAHLTEKPVVFYGKTHSLAGQLLRHRSFSKRILRPVTQKPTQETPHLSLVLQPKHEHATILSRSILADGDVRFIISVGYGIASTRRVVPLDELFDFVTLQQLHNFENTLFTQAHQADEEKAYRRQKRRGTFERKRGSVARHVERSAGYHSGADDATSIFQGPLVRHGGVGSFRGSSSRDSNHTSDGRTSDTTGISTPVLGDAMSSMGVHESEHARNTTYLLKPRQQDNFSTLSQRLDKSIRSVEKVPRSGTAQSPSVSMLSHSRKNKVKNERNGAAVLLQQFQEGQVFGLKKQPRPLVQHRTTLSSRSPRPEDVGAPAHSPTSSESKAKTQPTTSSAIRKKRRRLSDTITLPEDGKPPSQPKRTKPEPDDLEDDEEWLTVPPGLFPPSSDDELEVATRNFRKRSVQVEVSNRDMRVEKILADRLVRLGAQPIRQYHIKWLGCPTSQNTWEFEDDLHMADVMLKDYRVDRAVTKMRERTSHERQTVIIDLTREDD